MGLAIQRIWSTAVVPRVEVLRRPSRMVGAGTAKGAPASARVRGRKADAQVCTILLVQVGLESCRKSFLGGCHDLLQSPAEISWALDNN